MGYCNKYPDCHKSPCPNCERVCTSPGCKNLRWSASDLCTDHYDLFEVEREENRTSKLCTVHLPGNRQCTIPPFYTVEYQHANRRIFRNCCLPHLGAAIDDALSNCQVIQIRSIS